MSTAVSPAAFTISATTYHGPAAFPLFILLTDPITISLPIKQDTPQVASAEDKLFLSHANVVIKSTS